MIRYYIENYYWGLPILDDNDCYTKYFDSYEEADDYLNKHFICDEDEEDNFYIVKEINGKEVPIEL
tara:strand:+ start:737 stop:934 length:198 start_codon:yes stop_codon:yes gene_type:complete